MKESYLWTQKFYISSMFLLFVLWVKEHMNYQNTQSFPFMQGATGAARCLWSLWHKAITSLCHLCASCLYLLLHFPLPLTHNNCLPPPPLLSFWGSREGRQVWNAIKACMHAQAHKQRHLLFHISKITLKTVFDWLDQHWKTVLTTLVFVSGAPFILLRWNIPAESPCDLVVRLQSWIISQILF